MEPALPAQRMPDLLRRCQAVEMLVPGFGRRGMGEGELERAVRASLSALGAEAVFRRLSIPFPVQGEACPDSVVKALLAPPLGERREAARPFARRGEARDPLDALWNRPGDDRAGWAGRDSRMRAEPPFFPSPSYRRRSLLASLAADEAGERPKVGGEGVFLLAPHEVAEATGGRWREGLWGIARVGPDGISWGCASGEDPIRAAESGGGPVWPPLREFPSWLPGAEEERAALEVWLRVARANPVPPHHPTLGRPDEDIDW